MRKSVLLIVLLLTSLSFYGQEWQQITKLTASDGASWDRFGHTASVSGNVAIFGANLNDENGNNSGAAYIFEKEDGIWQEKQKLVDTDGDELDEYGYSVAISGETAVIGASSCENDLDETTGAVFIYEKEDGAWIFKQKLTPSVWGGEDWYGYAVAIFENLIVIGAPQSINDAGTETGAVFIYEKEANIWVEKQKIESSDELIYEDFGLSVSTDGEVIVVGSPRSKNQNEIYSGAAFVFKKIDDVWIETQKLLPSDSDNANDNDQWNDFGTSVSISENILLVGAPRNDNSNGYGAGAAYVFTKEGDIFLESQKLISSENIGSQYFGHSVSTKDDIAVVGSPGNSAESNGTYIFLNVDGYWSESQKLLPIDSGSHDNFGRSVSLSGNGEILVGTNASHNVDGDVEWTGAAYFFDIDFQVDIDSLSLCGGECGEIQLSSNLPLTHISWDNEIEDNQTSVFVCPTETMEYTATVTNCFNDTVIVTSLVTAVPSPVAAFSVAQHELSIFEDANFINESTNAAEWNWSIGQVLNTDQESPSYVFEEIGYYPVTLSVNNGDCQDEVTQLIYVKGNLSVYMPTAFSPDEDGLNDLLFPEIFGADESTYILQVFNRDGILVFESTDLQEKWNGVPRQGADYYSIDGVYNWSIQINEQQSSKAEIFRGFSIMIR